MTVIFIVPKLKDKNHRDTYPYYAVLPGCLILALAAYLKEEKVILEEFYVINMEKLLKLDDKIIAGFARKGWMGIFDAHLKSISNFEKILKAN